MARAGIGATGVSTFDQFVGALVQGVPVGAVYALVAIGLVLTYKTSGVFNPAFGAQAFVSAAVYYDARPRDGRCGSACSSPWVVPRRCSGWSWSAWCSATCGGAARWPSSSARSGCSSPFPRRSPRSSIRPVPSSGRRASRPTADGVRAVRPQSINPDELARRGRACRRARPGRSVPLHPAGLAMRAVGESPRMIELGGMDADRVPTGPGRCRACPRAWPASSWPRCSRHRPRRLLPARGRRDRRGRLRPAYEHPLGAGGRDGPRRAHHLAGYLPDPESLLPGRSGPPCRSSCSSSSWCCSPSAADPRRTDPLAGVVRRPEG